MIYFFLGPPASGKDTQAKLLAQALSFPFFSFGDAFRKIAEQDSDIAKVLRNGALVEEELVQKVYQELYEQYPTNCVVDGALRSAEQVEEVMHLWPKSNFIIIWIKIPDEVIRERTHLRKKSNNQARSDDQAATVEDRISLYRTNESAIAEALTKHDIPVIHIDGVGDINSIHQHIVKELSQYDHST